MSWIRVISYQESKGKLRRLYDKVTGPNNNVDNIMMVHGLRPHTMTGHMSLYKNVLHNSNNTLPKWYLEALGVLVSILNDCEYCVEHHFSGLKRLLNDDQKALNLRKALNEKEYEAFFEAKFSEALKYAEKLTVDLANVKENDVDRMRAVGMTDGEILEVNQVVSYFNYANRTVLGLGVSTKGDILGLSPNNSNDENHWNHQ
ncbi:peroxidase-related enzyme [Flavobacteriaceae bacterium S356]|uniref:Peroxidase-related enzyme n=1 Tax=Asprobacillus argus TaxID=3076534 RepID=A0ABU3LH44_9FLAO|nr:peroxidase-related enzyme [Flavobacteriaceae bacterium S356]